MCSAQPVNDSFMTNGYGVALKKNDRGIGVSPVVILHRRDDYATKNDRRERLSHEV